MANPTNNAFTDLKLTGVGVQPYSARGLTQTLSPITQAAQLRRTVNGILRDIAMAQFQKYQTVITGNDQEPPVSDGVWPGRAVEVECLATLSCVIGATKERPAVAGSAYDSGGFTIYRPVLQMRVVSFDQSKDEYGHVTQWTMTLEEI